MEIERSLRHSLMRGGSSWSQVAGARWRCRPLPSMQGRASWRWMRLDEGVHSFLIRTARLLYRLWFVCTRHVCCLQLLVRGM